VIRLLRALRVLLSTGVFLLQWFNLVDSTSLSSLSTLAGSAYIDVAYLLAVMTLFILVSASLFAPLYAGRLSACTPPGPASRAACAGAGLLAPRAGAGSGVLAPRAWLAPAGNFDGYGQAVQVRVGGSLVLQVGEQGRGSTKHEVQGGIASGGPVKGRAGWARASSPPPPPPDLVCALVCAACAACACSSCAACACSSCAACAPHAWP
jgi:hypothetical protein